MEHLKMQTADMADRNIEQIGALFPECLTERISSNGRVEQAIDFDKLRQLLAHDVVEGPEQRYQFTWPDKRAHPAGQYPDLENLAPVPCRKRRLRYHPKPLHRRRQPRRAETPARELPRQGEDDLHRSALQHG